MTQSLALLLKKEVTDPYYSLIAVLCSFINLVPVVSTVRTFTIPHSRYIYVDAIASNFFITLFLTILYLGARALKWFLTMLRYESFELDHIAQ
jgi:hypothetical protein